MEMILATGLDELEAGMRICIRTNMHHDFGVIKEIEGDYITITWRSPSLKPKWHIRDIGLMPDEPRSANHTATFILLG